MTHLLPSRRATPSRRIDTRFRKTDANERGEVRRSSLTKIDAGRKKLTSERFSGYCGGGERCDFPLVIRIGKPCACQCKSLQWRRAVLGDFDAMIAIKKRDQDLADEFFIAENAAIQLEAIHKINYLRLLTTKIAEFTLSGFSLLVAVRDDFELHTDEAVFLASLVAQRDAVLVGMS